MSLDDFHTLPKINGFCVSWQPQLRLQNYLKKFNANLGGLPEEELAYYLLKELQTNPDDDLKKIWQCWLSKSCLKIAQLRRRQLSGYLNQQDLVDLFQSCFILIGNPVNFFYSFKADYSDENFYSILKKFTYGKLKFCFYTTMREELNNHNIGLTDRGVAVREGKKKWVEVATTSLEIEQFTLLQGCIKEAKNIKNPCNKWTQEKFDEIGDRYNEKRGKLKPINGEIVKEILENVGKKIRLLENPPIKSTDESINLEQKNKTLNDIIPSVIFNDDYEEEITLLQRFIFNIIGSLKSKEKTIAFFSFYLGLNQAQTATDLGINQSTVSRFAVKIFKKLAKEFKQNSKKKLTSEQLYFLKETINDFYYDSLIHEIVKNNAALNPPQTPLLNEGLIDVIIDQIKINFDLQLTNNARDKLVNLVEEKLKILRLENCP